MKKIRKSKKIKKIRKTKTIVNNKFISKIYSTKKRINSKKRINIIQIKGGANEKITNRHLLSGICKIYMVGIFRDSTDYLFPNPVGKAFIHTDLIIIKFNDSDKNILEVYNLSYGIYAYGSFMVYLFQYNLNSGQITWSDKVYKIFGKYTDFRLMKMIHNSNRLNSHSNDGKDDLVIRNIAIPDYKSYKLTDDKFYPYMIDKYNYEIITPKDVSFKKIYDQEITALKGEISKVNQTRIAEKNDSEKNQLGRRHKYLSDIRDKLIKAKDRKKIEYFYRDKYPKKLYEFWEKKNTLFGLYVMFGIKNMLDSLVDCCSDVNDKIKKIKDDTNDYRINFRPYKTTFGHRKDSFFLYNIGVTNNTKLLQDFTFERKYSFFFNNCDHFTRGIIDFYNNKKDSNEPKLRIPFVSLTYSIILPYIQLCSKLNKDNLLNPIDKNNIKLYINTSPFITSMTYYILHTIMDQVVGRIKIVKDFIEDITSKVNNFKNIYVEYDMYQLIEQYEKDCFTFRCT